MLQKYSPVISYILFATFGVLSIVGVLHHTIWYDEAETWLLSKSSHSLRELYFLNRYVGDLNLWEFVLYALSRFTNNLIYMQWLNMAIAISAAFLFLRYSPFSIIQKVCILFSYFFLFEYNVICRSYGLTWLFIVLFCILFTQKKRNYVAILLENVHLLSLALSVPLFGMTLYFMRAECGGKRVGLLSILFIGGALFSLFNIMPPINAPVLQSLGGSFFSIDRISKASSFFVKGLYPLPDFLSLHFRDSNFIVTHLKPLSFLLTIIVLMVPAFMFSEKYFILLFFYAANFAVIFCLFMLKLARGTHYMGYSFMILLIALWLATDERFLRKAIFMQKWSAMSVKINTFIVKPFIWSIFVVQVVSGVSTYCLGLHFPFSESKNVAEYIKNNLPANSKTSVVPYSCCPSISAYLGKELYVPQINGDATFCQWEMLPPVMPVKKLAARLFESLHADTSRYGAFVFATEVDSLSTLELLVETGLDSNKYSIYKKEIFDKAIEKSENYIVFIVRRITPYEKDPPKAGTKI